MLKSLVQSVEVHPKNTARAEIIVSPAWLKAMIDHHTPGGAATHPTGDRQNHFVIIEASWARLAEARDYLAGHIPGALHLNTDELENGYPRWQLRKPQE